jgi:ABC-type phosphate transport system substrate-binding protein
MIGKNILWKSLPVVALALVSARAQAQDCVLGPNSLVISGSTAIAPVIKAAAGPLLTQGNIQVFYANTGSCAGTLAFVADQDVTGSVTQYDMTGATSTCTLPVGTKANLGVSDVFLSSCTDTPPDTGITDFLGPIQAMTYVVPKLSSQKALIAEEGYFAFGFGTAGYMGMTISPWADQTKFAIRNVGSGTQQMTARGVGITAAQMKGMDSGGSGGVVTALKTAGASPTTAEPAIGILGADVYDINRDSLQALAFQGFKQKFAYYPDSTSTSFDKKNVRDGHYVVWGPVHMIAKTGTDGKATNAKVQDLLDYLQLKKTLGTTNFIDIFTAAHVVPACAMRVSRTTELGPMTPSKPAAGTGCGCYFDKKIAGSTTCKVCTGPADCTDGTMCSNGFCE